MSHASLLVPDCEAWVNELFFGIGVKNAFHEAYSHIGHRDSNGAPVRVMKPALEREPMKPIVLAMVICDYYYRDAHTGKSILSGTFNSINSSAFPSKHGNCAVYVAITDVARDGELQLTFRKEGGDFSMPLPPWKVKGPESRRSVVEIGGNINGLPLPEQGYYEFVVTWDGAEIFTRRLRAIKIDVPQNPSKESEV